MTQKGPGNVYKIPRWHETQLPTISFVNIYANTIHAQVLVGVQVP